VQRVPEGFHHEHKSKGVAIATDIDDGSPGAYDLPTPTTAGALAAPVKGSKQSEQPVANGYIDDDEDARWIERAGWAPRFGSGDSGESMEGESLLDHQTWMEGKIEDKFYGGRLIPSVLVEICAKFS
jgi:hypothetical protein